MPTIDPLRHYVLMVSGVVAAYVAFQKPDLGVALCVGVAVVGILEVMIPRR